MFLHKTFSIFTSERKKNFVVNVCNRNLFWFLNKYPKIDEFYVGNVVSYIGCTELELCAFSTPKRFKSKT